MTDEYFAEGDYLRQASWLLVILMAETNRRLGSKDIRDGIPMLHIPIHGMDFRFLWKETFHHRKIKVNDGISVLGTDWSATHVRIDETNDRPSFVKVTGNIEAFERDMLLLKIKRSN